jgi:uncharacterized membrane protein
MILTFAVYALIGWLYETVVCSIKQRRFVYRGFLIGPFIPIYGFGALMITYATYGITDSLLAVFLVGMAVATLFEFVVGAILEVIFQTSWWNYDDLRFNYKGRIALLPSLVWGFGTLLVVYIVQPLVLDLDMQIYGSFGDIPYMVYLGYIIADGIFSMVQVARFRAYTRRVRKGWKKNGELDTAKYVRFLYREFRSMPPIFSLRNLIERITPDIEVKSYLKAYLKKIKKMRKR